MVMVEQLEAGDTVLFSGSEYLIKSIKPQEGTAVYAVVFHGTNDEQPYFYNGNVEMELMA